MKSKEENQQETMDNKESKIEECMEDQKQQDESTETPVQETENPENNEEETLAQKAGRSKRQIFKEKLLSLIISRSAPLKRKLRISL